MKRSEINAVIRDMASLIDDLRFPLPPFCHWTPEQWREKGPECDEIRDNMLGWDITDYGLGRFYETGFSLITLRNGNQKNKKYLKPYAEKLLMLYPGQNSPMHYHWYKMEDIINRGGNDVFITLYNGGEDGRLLDTPVSVSKDGVRLSLPAGTAVRLAPGESLTITPYLYHNFIMPRDGGRVLLGEVSMCNDDETDNRFYDPIGRFPAIEEDEAPYRLLCTEYPRAHRT